VRATDPAGNTDLTPASFTWTVDTTPPDTTMTASPTNPTNSSSASFSFDSSEAGSGFQCQLDAGGYLPCGSPQNYFGLGEGTHTFQVRATDAAGNTDATPATFSWTVDSSPPETSIGSVPSNPTNATGATFTFTSSESGSTFACKLDGAPFGACTSPTSYSGLAEGSHTFEVRATDAAGNTDPTPAARTWTIDTTAPPAPSIDSPAEGTLNNTGSFTLAGSAEPGTTVEVFEGAASRGTATAGGAGTWARALLSVPDGSHAYTAEARDAAGNVSSRSNVRTIVVDTSAPNTVIGSGPIGSTNSTGALFSFSADDPAATFECRLDGGVFAACSSPKSYNGLAEGSHTFEVRATDAAGNTDATPASRIWTVDLTPPAVPVIASPVDGSTITSSTVTLSGTADAGSFVEIFEGETFLGGSTATGSGTWTKSFLGVADGSYTYVAKAGDFAGNHSGPSNSVTVTVDTVAPNTSVDSGPTGSTNATSATLVFSSNDAGASFACRLDGAAFTSCTSPVAYTGLAAGSHTFEVRATDAAGNTDPTPAARTWTVDTTAPATSIDTAPADPTSDTDASFEFSSSEPSSTFECSLDGVVFAPCTSPAAYTGLAEGAHTFDVRATDVAGNTDPSPATHAWTVDTTPPDTSIDSGPADPTTDTSATFEFSSNDASAAFECSVDGAAFTACSDPETYTGLALGSHTFEVRAADAAGNSDASPATHAWIVE
jgi:large repetitive protein